jgi:hypothetical protein
MAKVALSANSLRAVEHLFAPADCAAVVTVLENARTTTRDQRNFFKHDGH